MKTKKWYVSFSYLGYDQDKDKVIISLARKTSIPWRNDGAGYAFGSGRRDIGGTVKNKENAEKLAKFMRKNTKTRIKVEISPMEN